MSLPTWMHSDEPQPEAEAAPDAVQPVDPTAAGAEPIGEPQPEADPPWAAEARAAGWAPATVAPDAPERPESAEAVDNPTTGPAAIAGQATPAPGAAEAPAEQSRPADEPPPAGAERAGGIAAPHPFAAAAAPVPAGSEPTSLAPGPTFASGTPSGAEPPPAQVSGNRWVSERGTIAVAQGDNAPTLADKLGHSGEWQALIQANLGQLVEGNVALREQYEYLKANVGEAVALQAVISAAAASITPGQELNVPEGWR